MYPQATFIVFKRQEKTTKAAPQNLYTECDKSIGAHIIFIFEHSSQLEVNKKSAVLTHHVALAAVTNLYDTLAYIDPAYLPVIHLAAYLPKIPKLAKFMDVHYVIPPCSLYIQRYNIVACCGKSCAHVEVRDTLVQRQPAPWKDPNRGGHFTCRDDVFVLFSNGSSALTDLFDLPSFKDNKQDASDTKKERDRNADKAAGLKSWETKKACSLLLTCFNHGKCRCVFPKENRTDYKNATVALQQKL